jgi:endonuclease/exonuclease/phosphatase family metal-dependent hydrolase
MADGPRLRVLSYNVHGLRDDPGAVAAAVRAAAPDVVILQEAPRRFRWRTRIADLAHRFDLVYAGGGLPSLGNVVLTNLRVHAHEQWCLQYPLTPGRHLRGAVFVRCTVGRVPFIVAGSHLATDPGERPAQAVILKKVLADLDAPVVLGIDLNEGPGGGAWRTVADGLTDPAVTTGRAHATTFPAAEPRHRIDAIFADPRCTVVDYRVLDAEPATAASDHLPVLVDLSLPVG